MLRLNDGRTDRCPWNPHRREDRSWPWGPSRKSSGSSGKNPVWLPEWIVRRKACSRSDVGADRSRQCHLRFDGGGADHGGGRRTCCLAYSCSGFGCDKRREGWRTRARTHAPLSRGFTQRDLLKGDAVFSNGPRSTGYLLLGSGHNPGRNVCSPTGAGRSADGKPPTASANPLSPCLHIPRNSGHSSPPAFSVTSGGHRELQPQPLERPHLQNQPVTRMTTPPS